MASSGSGTRLVALSEDERVALLAIAQGIEDAVNDGALLMRKDASLALLRSLYERFSDGITEREVEAVYEWTRGDENSPPCNDEDDPYLCAVCTAREKLARSLPTSESREER